MKAMPRSRGDKEESEKHIGLLKLVQSLSFLVVFVAGVVIGLATSSHINQHFNPQAEVYSFINHYSTNVPVVEEKNCTILKECEKAEDCLSMKVFLKPNNLTHRMSDDELFWRASMVPIKEEYPYKRVPKVAFMFLTRGPLPMLPLWERFFNGHEKLFSVYVHALPGYILNVTNTSAFYQRQIPSQVCPTSKSYHCFLGFVQYFVFANA